MGAVAGAIFMSVRAGDHALFCKAKYSGTEDITRDFLPRFGVEVGDFDPQDLATLEEGIKDNTKLIYVESPANPTMVMADIAAISAIAHKHGIKSGSIIPLPHRTIRILSTWEPTGSYRA